MAIAEQLQRIADKQQLVYDAGFTAGSAQGGNTEEAYNQGFEEGKKSEYDAFWDSYLNSRNGNCDSMFAGQGWNNTLFKPKYSLKPTRCQYMFSLSAIKGNLREMLENLNVEFNFSNCKLFNSMFANCGGITETPPIDISIATDTNNMFVNASSIVTIGTLTCSENTVFVVNSFNNLTNLENITFSGVIASSIKFAQSSKLTKESIMNIINALKDYSGTTKTATLTLHNASKLLLTDAEKALITQKGWTLA